MAPYRVAAPALPTAARNRFPARRCQDHRALPRKYPIDQIENR